jgi:hypothetical protein
MLTAGLLAAVLVSTASAAGRSRAPLYAVENRSLLRLDAETLAVSGRAPYEGNSCGSFRSARAWSPDHRRLAVADDCHDAVSIFDVRKLGRTSLVQLQHSHPRAFAWPTRRRLLVVLIQYGDVPSPLFARIDTEAARRLRDWRGSYRTWQSEAKAFGGNVMAIATPGPAFGCCEEWLGAPLWFSALGRSGELVSLPTAIRLGIENWHVTASAPLPPAAARAVSGAREDFARRRGIGVDETRALGVTPWKTWGRSGYYVTVSGRGEVLRYRCTYPCEQVGTPYSYGWPPPYPENDLLRAENGTWEAVDAALVDARARDRALIVTSGRVYADVDLTRVGSGGPRIRYHGLREYLGQSVDGPAHVPGRKIFVPVRSSGSSGVPDQLVLLDLRTNRLRRLDSAGGFVEPAGSGVLLYGGGPNGTGGVTFFDAGGHRRYTILEGKRVARVQGRKPFAYVTIWRGEIGDRNHTETAVVRLDSGRVLRTVTFPTPVELLVGRALPFR